MATHSRSEISSSILPKKLYTRVISKSNQKKEPHQEIPIVARERFPGPAAYTLPPTIGFNAKSKGPRSPAYSFGVKLKFPASSNQEDTPGPNMFFPQATRTGTSKGTAFSLKGGRRKKDGIKGVETDIWDTYGLETPGPGEYNPKFCPSKEPRAPAYSISPRTHAVPEEDSPGPASYDIQSTLGLNPIVTVPAPPAYSIKPLRAVVSEHISPGPAAYKYNPSIVRRSAPVYSLSSRVFKKVSAAETSNIGTTTPGPTEYSPKLRFVRDHIPQFSFRCKHSDHERFVPDVVNEEFS